MITVAERYAHARDYYGMTVEEWEAAEGLPPFTVAPRARAARLPAHEGHYMYSDRTALIAEEDRQMRCLHALGVSLKQIARLYNTHFCRVQKRVRGHA